jgi:hypothetical protein
MTGQLRRSCEVLGALLLGLGASTASADVPPPLRSVQAYDEFHDVTTLRLNFGPVYRGEHHEVEVGLTWFCKGRDRNSPVQGTSLRFVSDSSDGWVYLEYHPAALLVDGERFEFDTQHDGPVGRGYILEFITARISDARLRALAEAREIRGKIGLHEFRLTPDQLDALRVFTAFVHDPTLEVPDPRAPKPPKPPTPEEVTAQEAREAKARADAVVARQREMVAKAETKLRLAENLERQGKFKGALAIYKEIVRDLSETPQASVAEMRIKALTLSYRPHQDR